MSLKPDMSGIEASLRYIDSLSSPGPEELRELRKHTYLLTKIVELLGEINERMKLYDLL